MNHNMVLSYNYGRRIRWRQQTKAPPLQAVSIAMTVQRCNTVYISQCSMTRASPEATERCHWASTHSDRHQSDMPTPISGVYFIVKSLKKSSSCPKNNRSVTHQTDEKHLNNMSEYFVGVVNKVFNRCNNRFL